jgi:phosphoglycolate phosphatase
MIVRSLILDLDGTLIDSRPGILESLAVAASAVFPGINFDPTTVRLGPPVRGMFEISFPKASQAEIGKLVFAFRESYDSGAALKTELYEGARDVLAKCQQRSIDLYIATNKPAQISSAILAHFKIEHFFRQVMAADSTEPPFASKAAIIFHLMRTHQLNPAATLYVGDSMEDTSAAAECGVGFVWAAYGYGKLDARTAATPGRSIEALGELHRFLD